MITNIIIAITLSIIALFLFMLTGMAAIIFNTWRAKMASTHEKTVVRLFMTEEAHMPEIQTFLDEMPVDELIGIVGALEIAKNMVISSIPVEELTEEEAGPSLGLLDGEEEEDE